MKTIVCFENEERSCLYNSMVLKKIRKLYPEKLLVMIFAGNFRADGTLTGYSAGKRSEEYVKAGADLLLDLPAASSLGGNGKKEFAGAALAQRLKAGDELVIPCTPVSGQSEYECGQQLKSLAMLMFKEEHGYRSLLTQYLNEKMPLRKAQLKAVLDCAPSCEELLSYQENQYALWLLDAMLQLYYMPSVKFMEAPECAVNRDEAYKADDFERSAALEIGRLLASGTKEFFIDISGSTSQMVSALFENRQKVLESQSLEEMVKLLEPSPKDSSRLFLLKAALGIKKIYMQICGLHVFVPYCHAAAENPDAKEGIRQLEEASWVPFVRKNDAARKEVENYYYLLRCDELAEELLN